MREERRREREVDAAASRIVVTSGVIINCAEGNTISSSSTKRKIPFPLLRIVAFMIRRARFQDKIADVFHKCLANKVIQKIPIILNLNEGTILGHTNMYIFRISFNYIDIPSINMFSEIWFVAWQP